MSNDTYTRAGDVTIRDLVTKELIRIDKCYTRKELKAIVNKDKPHKNSISMLIKHDPELSAKYNKAQEKYYQDYEAKEAQERKNVNAIDLDT